MPLGKGVKNLFVDSVYRGGEEESGPRTLCNSPETSTEWKSESVTYKTGVGSRDAYVSKNRNEIRNYLSEMLPSGLLSLNEAAA